MLQHSAARWEGNLFNPLEESNTFIDSRWMEHNRPLVLQSGAASSHSPISFLLFHLILHFLYHSHGLGPRLVKGRGKEKLEVLPFVQPRDRYICMDRYLPSTPPSSRDIEWPIEWPHQSTKRPLRRALSAAQFILLLPLSQAHSKLQWRPSLPSLVFCEGQARYHCFAANDCSSSCWMLRRARAREQQRQRQVAVKAKNNGWEALK